MPSLNSSTSAVGAAGGEPLVASHGMDPSVARADLAALRLVLAGESVVDLPRLYFRDKAAVKAFLRVQGFDADNPMHMARIADIHREAVVYLSEYHGFHLPLPVVEPPSVHDFFLMASRAEGQMARCACIVLKVMHVLHHVAGRETVFQATVSEAELYRRLAARVYRAFDRMRGQGIGVQEFAAGKKSGPSMLTKLLAKRSTLVSSIFDRVRFRLTVNSRDDLVHALVFLLNSLVPFNYVLPEQSQNGLLRDVDIARALGLDLEEVRAFWPQASQAGQHATPRNEFSGATYRCVNFVADIPVRMDDVMQEPTPAIAFVSTEIQLVDAEAAAANALGQNAHDLYKGRQLQRVAHRLAAPTDVADMLYSTSGRSSEDVA